MKQAELFGSSEPAAKAGLRVGTSGFSFDDWVGPVYPRDLPKAKMLEYYEQALGFDTVELNYTYYSMPVPRTMESMVRRTGDGFRFVVRSHKDMTHDIWEDKGRKVLKDTSAAFGTFRDGIQPLVDAGRLGCVLVQLPFFFWPSKDNYDYLRKLPERLPGVPLVVEFRNKAWVRESAYRLIEEAGMGWCVVDEPKLPRLLPFDPRRTSDTAYFRFHGRNQNWFNAPREERYNYLYSRDELAGFVEPVQGTAKEAARTFVFFNNCHAGAAARNAILMKRLLGLVNEFTAVQQRVVEGSGPAGSSEPELPLA